MPSDMIPEFEQLIELETQLLYKGLSIGVLSSDAKLILIQISKNKIEIQDEYFFINSANYDEVKTRLC